MDGMGKGKLRAFQEISNRSDPLNGPRKPGYLIALSNLLRGPLVRSHSIFDGTFDFQHVVFQESTC